MSEHGVWPEAVEVWKIVAKLAEQQRDEARAEVERLRATIEALTATMHRIPPEVVSQILAEGPAKDAGRTPGAT